MFSEANMGQVTIYLDDETERLAREAALAKGISLSKWVDKKVRRGARAEWPAAVRELAGAWTDLESTAEIRARAGRDIPRGSL
jgi:hypothetical protein